MDEALWALGRGTGVVGLALFSLALVLGITVRSGRSAAGLPKFGVARLHRDVALLATVFVGIHIVSLLFDSYAQLQLVDLVVPFLAAYQPFWLGLGTLAVDLTLAVGDLPALATVRGARDRRGHGRRPAVVSGCRGRLLRRCPRRGGLAGDRQIPSAAARDPCPHQDGGDPPPRIFGGFVMINTQPSVPRLLAAPSPSLHDHSRTFGQRPSPSAAELIGGLERAGLDGRGGAGFPAHRKLHAVAAQPR